MSAKQRQQKKSIGPVWSRALRARTLGPILVLALLAFCLGGCGHNTIADRLIGQSNIELLYVLSEPQDPLGKIQYQPGDTIEAWSVAFVNDILIAIGTWGDDVFFADVSNPNEPTLVSVFRTLGRHPTDIAAMDGFVYVDDAVGATVIDLDNSAAPKRVNFIYENGQVFAAEDGYLYMIKRSGAQNRPSGIQIWDARNPPFLKLAGVYTPPQYRVVERNLVHRRSATPTPRQLAAERSVYAGTFTLHEKPAVSVTSCEPGIIYAADIEDGLLYAFVGSARCKDVEDRSRWREDVGGLWIIDVNDPTEPIAVGFLSIFSPNDIKVAGNYAYLAGGIDGLVIVDVSDPAKPEVVGGYDIPYVAMAVAVEGDVVYLMDPFGLHVLRVTNPAEPVRIGLMTGFLQLKDVAVRDGYIYLAGDDYETEGVHILQLIDPNARPFELQVGAPGD